MYDYNIILLDVHGADNIYVFIVFMMTTTQKIVLNTVVNLNVEICKNLGINCDYCDYSHVKIYKNL